MELIFETIKDIGILSEKQSGLNKKLVYGSWNEREPKYEIRAFSKEGKPLKGIGLTREEAIKLKELLEKEL